MSRAWVTSVETRTVAEVERDATELVDELVEGAGAIETLSPAVHAHIVRCLERVCGAAPRACVAQLLVHLSRARLLAPAPLACTLEAVGSALRAGGRASRPLRLPALQQVFSGCARAIARRPAVALPGEALVAGAALALCDAWAGQGGPAAANSPARLLLLGALASRASLSGYGGESRDIMANVLALRRIVAGSVDCAVLARFLWSAARGDLVDEAGHSHHETPHDLTQSNLKRYTNPVRDSNPYLPLP
jgi:hypothetical protein